MPRPVCLFTGQWADLPLETLAAKAKAFGYDGLTALQPLPAQATFGDPLRIDPCGDVILQRYGLFRLRLIAFDHLRLGGHKIGQRRIQGLLRNPCSTSILAQLLQPGSEIARHLFGQRTWRNHQHETYQQ